MGEPNLGLQFDLYHRQIEDGDVAVAMKEYAGLTRHYQIANPPDRGEPDEGDLNYRWLLQQIDASGYTGLGRLRVQAAARHGRGPRLGRGLRGEAGVRLSSRGLSPGSTDPRAPEHSGTMDPGDKHRDDKQGDTMKVLIIGGAGMIGRKLAERLAQRRRASPARRSPS